VQNKKIKKKKIKLRKTPNPLSSIKATSIKRSLFLFYQKRTFTTYNYKKEKKKTTLFKVNLLKNHIIKTALKTIVLK